MYFPYVECLLHNTTESTLSSGVWSDLLDQIDGAAGPWLIPPASHAPKDNQFLREGMFRYCDPSFLLAAAVAAQKAGHNRRSWEYLRHANKMELRRYSQSVAASTNQTLAAQAEGSAISLLQQNELYPLSIKPIFVTGLPFSGLGELLALLDSHSNILAMAARPQYFSLLEGSTNSAVKYSVAGSSLEQLQKLVLSHSSWLSLHKTIDELTPDNVRDQIEGTLKAIAERINRARGDVDKTHTILAQHATRPDITSHSRGYLGHPRQFADIKFIVDYDQMHFLNFPILNALYPGSLLINVVSDPLQMVAYLCALS
jgi:hypothetical protein